MSRVGNPASPPLVTELALTVSHFETENARLASQLDLLDGRQTLRDEGEPTHDGPGTPSQVFSRRGALMAMGGVAAGGLGLAVGSTMLSAEAGAADSGSAVFYLPDPTRIYDTRVAGVYPA